MSPVILRVARGFAIWLFALLLAIPLTAGAPGGLILFVYPLTYLGLLKFADWLQHRHEIKNLDQEFAEVLDKYKRDR